MSFELGMPTLIELKNIEENINLCKELELDFIELNMNLPYCMPENNNMDDLLRIIKVENIGFTMHFPEEVDFSAMYPTIRAANIELFKELSYFGAKLGAKKMNIHISPGVYFSLPTQKAWIYDINKDRFIHNLMSSIGTLISIAKQNDMKLCVENTAFPKFIEDAFYQLSKLKDIYFTWDVGHDEKDNLRTGDFYMKHISKIAHMHLHDYDGERDHLCLFDGNMNINSKIEFARTNSITTVVEVKTINSLKKSIVALRERGC